MKFKRLIALALAVVLCLALALPASAAAPKVLKAEDFPDFDKGAWYAEAVEAAVANGLLYGDGKGRLNPNGNLTRAEMAAVINRSFGTYVTADISQYKDVAKNKWYYKDVQMAVQMGTYEGTSASTMAPERPITRQEIMAVVARALQLDLEDYSKTDLSEFRDHKDVADWALPYVKAMVGADYIHGRGIVLAPTDYISRAEFAQVFHNIIRTYITKSGSFSGSCEGNLLIRSRDVNLHDATINGDLIIGNGAADSKVTLQNVTINGRLVVWGGGTEAVYANGGTDVPELIVCRVDNPVKVIFDKDSTLKVIEKIDVAITKRAEAFPETEVIFYEVKELLSNQKELNDIVDKNQIQVTMPSYLQALVGKTEVKAEIVNRSKTDEYRIEIRRDDTEDLIADAFTLAAGKSCASITLLEAPEYGNYPCTATVTAMRNGEAIGSVEVALTLCAAYLWAE